MTVGKLEDAEKIVRMTEWNDIETWEYSPDEELTPESNLGAARRFLAAQSFLLSWQEGRVPVGWRRPRRIEDFDGKYPASVIDMAEEIIGDRIAERTYQQTVRLNAVINAREKSATEAEKPPPEKLDKKQIEGIKSDFSKFNREFFEVKSALSKATAAIGDISFRIQALSEELK